MILEITKEINSEEELLDQNLTSFKDIQEKLEIAQKESVEAELQAWFSTKIGQETHDPYLVLHFLKLGPKVFERFLH